MLNKTSPATLAETSSATRDAQYFEYTSSANPIGAKLISRVPFRNFPPSLYADGPTRVVPLPSAGSVRSFACHGGIGALRRLRVEPCVVTRANSHPEPAAGGAAASSEFKGRSWLAGPPGTACPGGENPDVARQ